MNTPYQFPVKTMVEAMRVTSPNFNPDLIENDLYVDFDSLRSEDVLTEIKRQLGIFDNELIISNDYEPILISGHRGCGKTSELKKLQIELNKFHLFSSIYISVEEEIGMTDFNYEKLLFLMLSKLIEYLQDNEISSEINALQDLIDLINQNVTKEIQTQKRIGIEASAEAGVGFSLFELIKSKVDFKNRMSLDKQFVNKIVETISLNKIDFVNKLNLALIEVRRLIIEKKLGKDLLFIIDGTEKIDLDRYKQIFIDNINVIKSIRCNLIFCIDIRAYYEIDKGPLSFQNRHILPMLSTEKDKNYEQLMKHAVSKRLDTHLLIESEALTFIIEQAAGCIRQMYNLINSAIVKTATSKVDIEAAEKAAFSLGKTLYEMLSTEHKKALNEVHNATGETDYGNRLIADLLLHLHLLKYNGKSKVNPVILTYFKIDKGKDFGTS